MTSANTRLSKLEQKLGEQREVVVIEVHREGETDTQLGPPVTVRDDAKALVQVRWPVLEGSVVEEKDN